MIGLFGAACAGSVIVYRYRDSDEIEATPPDRQTVGPHSLSRRFI